jgi:fibronectin-binding autotransporter adhesin
MNQRSVFTAAVLLAAGLSVQVQAQMTTYNWVGGGANTGWNLNENWSPAPTFNNNAALIWNSSITDVFSFLAGTDGSTRVAGSVTFGNNFDIGAGNENYTIRLRSAATTGSATLSLRGTPSITLEQNLGLGKDLKTVFIGNNNGTFDFRTANLVVNQHSTNVLLRFNAAVTKTDAGPLGIDKNGAGAMELYRNNSFDGGINIHAGTVALWNTTTAAGSGAITLGAAAGADAATLALGGSASLEQTRANNITVNSGAGARTIRNYESGLAAAIGGNITLNKNVNFDVANHGVNQDKITVSGVISGDFGVNKTGNGILELSGMNTYSGRTTVESGTLTLKAGQTVSDESEMILTASASLVLDFSGSVTVKTLSLDGGITFLAPGTYTAAQLSALGSGTYSGSGSVNVLRRSSRLRLVILS